MNPVSVDIKDILVEEHIGAFAGTADWAIYIGSEPALPNKCITVYDTGGEKPGYYYDEGHPPTQNRSFQVRVRSMEYLQGYNQLESIINAVLENCGQFDVSCEDGDEVHYANILKQSDVAFVGQDENNRYLFTCNYSVKREKTGSSS